MKQRVFIVSDYYWPEDVSTGYFLTGIAEGLARKHPVTVLCGQPAVPAKHKETHNHVIIHRHNALGKKDGGILSRLIRSLHFGLGVLFSILSLVEKDQIVIVVTTPPFLPHFVRLGCWIKKARCVLLVHDVYPEVLVATKIAQPGSALVSLTGWVQKKLYRSMHRIIVLGRDMDKLIKAYLTDKSSLPIIIPNWGDAECSDPIPKDQNPYVTQHNLHGKFVIQYSGNMGRTHDIESLIIAAEKLQDKPDIHFLLCGWGSKLDSIKQSIEAKKLPNVTLLPRQRREDLPALMDAADVLYIGFIAGMAGVSVPSRLYNMMRAGKPFLAVTDDESELAHVIKEENIGWSVPPGDHDRLIEAIIHAKENQDPDMGKRSQAASQEKYSYDAVVKKFEDLVEGLVQDMERS